MLTQKWCFCWWPTWLVVLSLSWRRLLVTSQFMLPFFWVVSIESVSRKIRCCCTSWRTRTNMTDRQFEPCMTDQQAAFLFFVQEVMGNSNACDGPTFTAWTFELVWNDWVSSCSFWSFTRWEHEGQPKAWASVHIVIDWLYARSGHWLSLHPLRHWHLYVFAGLDGRLRWWCLFSMTSSQWRAWIKVWAVFFNHAVIDHWVCVRACGCLWVVSGATCNELLAWALEFSCHSWFVTLCTVQVNNDRSIDIFNHSGQRLSKGIDSKSVFRWLWVSNKVTDLSFNQEWMLNVPWPLYSHLILLPCGPMGPRQWQFHGRQSLSLHRFSSDCLVNEFQITVLFSAFMACQWLSDFVSVTRTVTLWPFGFWSTWERQSSQCQCQTSWQMIQLDNQPF